jgi:hypothetical protein
MKEKYQKIEVFDPKTGVVHTGVIEIAVGRRDKSIEEVKKSIDSRKEED